MRYHNITKCDMLNGDGLRVVLWVSHCTHNCKGCHNPQTHKADSGIIFDNGALEEIYKELDKDYISGITFSGGDPLSYLNRNEVINLIKDIKGKYPSKNIWLYTGYVWESISHIKGIEYVDVLVDGRYDENLRDVSLNYVGSSNQRIIKVKDTILKGEIVLKS